MELTDIIGSYHWYLMDLLAINRHNILVCGSLNNVSKKERGLGYTCKLSCNIFHDSSSSYGMGIMCLDRHAFVFVELAADQLRLGKE